MRIALAVVVVSLALMAVPAFAEDGNNVADQIGDALSGKGQTYLGVEAIKDFQLDNPIMGVGVWGVKVWTDVMVSEVDDDVRRDVRGGARLRLIF